MPRSLTMSEAASVLGRARRLLVIGNSGAGKSTLAQKIAASRGLRYLSHDRDIRWLPGWQVRDRAEQRARTAELVAGEAWIMCGTTVSSFDLRVPRAELVIWMRPTRGRALWQLARRVIAYRGSVRPDMAEGCPEKWPDAEFLRWIWTFERVQAPKIEAGLALHGPEVPLVTLSGPRAADRLLTLAGL
ncbi:hypothetical protein [Litorisediminicola beolgyonensis]|uniref:AAA family ATPase n=1 Tax=Litorisediminicola beolgyonensis TaxID=1173614 RepID=A0ABW3ZK67_9RHOB